MDRGVRIRAADRSSTGPAHASRSHPGNERGKLPPQRQQAPTSRETTLLDIRLGICIPICRVGLRSGQTRPARRVAGLRSSRPRKSVSTNSLLPRNWSIFRPPQRSSFTPPLTGVVRAVVRDLRQQGLELPTRVTAKEAYGSLI